MFHPRPTQWFDLMVPQASLGAALEALSAHAAVELEAGVDHPAEHLELADLRPGLEIVAERARQYRAYWPAPDRETPFPARPPAEVLKDALARLDAWALDAHPLISRQQAARTREADLRHLAALAEAAGGAFPTRLFAGMAGRTLGASVHVLHEGRGPERVPADVMTQRFAARDGDYLLAVGTKDSVERLDAELAGVKARRILLPEGLGRVAVGDLGHVLADRILEERGQQAHNTHALEALAERHALAEILAHLERLGWLAEHAQATANTLHFARITGWTVLKRAALERVLDAAGLTYALAVGAAPLGKVPPLLLDNPAWARPFEAFVRLLGMPGRSEADPSPLVALIAPMLFGFMFGDVGQGLVLLLAGLYLRRKLPAAAILVPGGLFAMLFGLAFGSVFAREDLIAAVWLHPLLHPLPVLGVALGAGVAILLTGLALNAAGAHWRGEGGAWWRSGAGLVAAYAGVLLAFADSRALWLSLAGAAWFVAGAALNARPGHGVVALGHALGEMVETLFQLVINTLSFVRVGAFAIAHAGLSSAIMVLAQISGDGTGFWLVMIAGNVFVIALEGLVAGIQTTRLMLFEFFIRFLRAEGRAFRALPTPAAWAMHFQERTT